MAGYSPDVAPEWSEAGFGEELDDGHQHIHEIDEIVPFDRVLFA